MTEYKNCTNDYLREVIRSHFEKQNERITNLQTAKKASLISIIEKYNIEVPEKPKKEKKKRTNIDTKKKYYEIRKEGKTNILIFHNKEYRVGHEFIIQYGHYYEGKLLPNVMGVICNITPKQVHYKEIYDDIQHKPTTKNSMYKPTTHNFIISHLYADILIGIDID